MRLLPILLVSLLALAVGCKSTTPGQGSKYAKSRTERSASSRTQQTTASGSRKMRTQQTTAAEAKDMRPTRQVKRYGPFKSIPRTLPSPRLGDRDPWRREDELAKRFSEYSFADLYSGYGQQWYQDPTSQLAKAFDAVRASSGWGAFVEALATGDSSVNGLLDQDIVDWSNAGPKIALVTRSRNAWRKAVSYGITPPVLPLGWYRFTERGLTFILHVRNENDAALMIFSPRGRMIGIFELALWSSARRHPVRHMMQRSFRYTDLYLNYPWNVIIGFDSIFIDKVWVHLDRLNNEATVWSSSGEVRRQGGVD